MMSDPLHVCDADGCTNDGRIACTLCKIKRYCSLECQQASWPAHKLECKGEGASESCDLEDHTSNGEGMLRSEMQKGSDQNVLQTYEKVLTEKSGEQGEAVSDKDAKCAHKTAAQKALASGDAQSLAVADHSKRSAAHATEEGSSERGHRAKRHRAPITAGPSNAADVEQESEHNRGSQSPLFSDISDSGSETNGDELVPGTNNSSNNDLDQPSLPPRNAEEHHCTVLSRSGPGSTAKGSNSRYQCNYCGLRYIGGPQKIRVHLTGHSEGAIRTAKCPSAPAEVRVQMENRRRTRKPEGVPAAGSTHVVHSAAREVPADPVHQQEQVIPPHYQQQAMFGPQYAQIQLLHQQHQQQQQMHNQQAYQHYMQQQAQAQQQAHVQMQMQPQSLSLQYAHVPHHQVAPIYALQSQGQWHPPQEQLSHPVQHQYALSTMQPVQPPVPVHVPMHPAQLMMLQQEQQQLQEQQQQQAYQQYMQQQALAQQQQLQHAQYQQHAFISAGATQQQQGSYEQPGLYQRDNRNNHPQRYFASQQNSNHQQVNQQIQTHLQQRQDQPGPSAAESGQRRYM